MSQADKVTTPPAPAQRSATILIVEDDPQLAAVMRDTLTMEGHRIDTARTGEQAWQRLRDQEYDVILCNLALPGLGGPRLYRRVADAHPDLLGRLIFVSGYGSRDAETLVSDTPAPVLLTPFRVDDLVKVVEDALRPA